MPIRAQLFKQKIPLSKYHKFNLSCNRNTGKMFSREVLALSTPWRSEYGIKMKFWKINPLTKNINFSSMNLKGLDFGANIPMKF